MFCFATVVSIVYFTTTVANTASTAAAVTSTALLTARAALGDREEMKKGKGCSGKPETWRR
jgi:hypothetical protein